MILAPQLRQVSESSDSAGIRGRRRIETFDVGIVGGGICGVSAAAFLASEGLSVALFEGTEIAAAASGRNSGAIQRPFDDALAELHLETLAIYRELADGATDFQITKAPAGLLIISPDEQAVASAARAIAHDAPDLEPELLSAQDLPSIEPMLAPGLAACRLNTGWPVAPALATRLMAERAERAGAVLRVGKPVESVVVDGQRATGVVLGDGSVVPCNRVVVAAGPWTPELVPGWSGSDRIRSVWGVVVSVRMEQAPMHVIEELGIDRPGRPPEELFSLMTAGQNSSVGSTFLTERPDPAQRAPRLLERGAQFVPGLHSAQQVGVRACARPLSFDGRPFVGAVPHIDGLYVCAGHGPWGISTGPGSARLLADIMAGRRPETAAFSPARGVPA